MKTSSKFAALAVLALLTLPGGAFAQDKDTEHGSVDFGVRFATGDVTGRPDLPFQPGLKTSKFNEYRDVRDGFYVRRFDFKFENILNTKDYVSLQSQRAVYRDQSYLATFGSYGKFKIQFRYDEIPHIYSNTTRTLFTEISPGVWTFPALIRQSIQNCQTITPAPCTSVQSLISTQVVPQMNFITPSIIRRAGTGSLVYRLNSDWSVDALFFRESQKGLRPIGTTSSSPGGATATAGFGEELPEPINYFNNRVRFGVEYGRHDWGLQAAYLGSFFQNNIGELVWDNPFRLTGETSSIPLTGRMDLYPDNQAHYLSFAGAADFTKYLRVVASVTPGWLRQSDAFLPYSTNTAINNCGTGTQACTSLSALPAPSLNGDLQTLAMNYTLVTTAWKNVELKANYRHYDFNDNTAINTFTPVQADLGSAGSDENSPFGFNRKNLELTGNWFFAKKSSLKLGYEAEWMDRVHRDAAHSIEHSFFTAVDWVPIRDLLVRVSYRHSDRKPDEYQDENASDPTTGVEIPCTDTTTTVFTADQRCHRRFDEAARLRNRADYLVQYDLTDKLAFSAFGGTLQDNYNRAGGTNSAVPLNFVSGTTAPYYLYGVQKDIFFNYGFDADYVVSPEVTLFAEYSREKYHKRMITRYRAPQATSGTGGCGPSTTGAADRGACDTANNDWESTAREPVDIYSVGVDWSLGKKVSFTTYYSLSAGKANVLSRPLGDPVNHPFLTSTGAPPNDPNRFVLVGTNAAVDYPETVNRNHDLAVVFKYKLTNSLMPRFEYHYQQWDYKDYQTSAMTPYMGCVSAAPPTATVPGCTDRILDSSTSPAPNPGSTSPFYPYFVVGDTGAARYLFLGVDQPSYHAHTFMATLEYRF